MFYKILVSYVLQDILQNENWNFKQFQWTNKTEDTVLEDIIKMDLKELGCRMIHLAVVEVQW